MKQIYELNVDHDLLKQQKEMLVEAMDHLPRMAEQFEGILNLMDSIQDQGEEKGYASAQRWGGEPKDYVEEKVEPVPLFRDTFPWESRFPKP